MMLTDIDVEKINDELIKRVLFTVPKINYEEADYLIIFGCHLKDLLDERINKAISIFKNKKIDKIILTGGIGVNGNFNESEYMLYKLLNNDINENKIIIENKSTTTEENVINTIQILKNNNLLNNKKIVLVSNEAHLRRIGMEFKKILKNYNIEIMYEYPELSEISFSKIISNEQLKNIAVKEIKKIIGFIDKNVINDEKIDCFEN